MEALWALVLWFAFAVCLSQGTPAEDSQAKKMTYERFIYELERLEGYYQGVSSDQMAHKLRMLTSRYNNILWKVMLNVNNPFSWTDKSVSPFDRSQHKTIFDLITEMQDHKFSGGAEMGVIKIGGETVALGHVITGCTAGYDHNTLFGMDNLFATTISGDLGQSGLANDADSSSPIIGPKGSWRSGRYVLPPGKGGGATYAEVVGDIDGFNLGKRIMKNPSKKLSQHFREYYSGSDSRSRFRVFARHTTKARLQTEVYRFANLYDYYSSGITSILQNLSIDLAVRRAHVIDRVSKKAIADFCYKYSSLLGSCVATSGRLG